MHENVVEDGGKGGVINCATTTHMQDTCSHMLSTSKLLFLLGCAIFVTALTVPTRHTFAWGWKVNQGFPKVQQTGLFG